MLPPVVRVSFLSPELGEGSSNEVRWLTGGPPWLIVDCLVRALGSRVAGASSPCFLRSSLDKSPPPGRFRRRALFPRVPGASSPCFLRSSLDKSPPQGRFRYHGARLQPRITH